MKRILSSFVVIRGSICKLLAAEVNLARQGGRACVLVFLVSAIRIGENFLSCAFLNLLLRAFHRMFPFPAYRCIIFITTELPMKAIPLMSPSVVPGTFMEFQSAHLIRPHKRGPYLQGYILGIGGCGTFQWAADMSQRRTVLLSIHLKKRFSTTRPIRITVKSLFGSARPPLNQTVMVVPSNLVNV